MKKLLALLTTFIIIFVWVITLTNVGGIGPIKDKIKLGLDLSGGVYVVMEAQTDAKGEELSNMMKQTQAVIEERVNSMGVSEPIVTIEGEDRIRVELPGLEDSDEAIETIGKTAQLKFVLADGTEVLTGNEVKKSSVATDEQTAGYVVTLSFNKEGADAFYEATKKASSGQVKSESEEIPNDAIVIMLDDEIISYPSASKGISGGEAQITGNFDEEEAMELSLLISAGSLPVDLKEVESSEVGATLGLGALEDSVIAGAIGVIAIFILMIVMYRVLGMAANLALLLYIPVVLWIIVLIGAVMTLPGIAGIILSIGMAVDANVIIFARVKEEVADGKSVRSAASSGFRRAMTTVIDSQITTMIAGIVLYQFGTGSVKGFAMTLMIGIVVSIITAVIVTHLYVSLIADSKIFGTKKMIGIKEDNKSAIGFKKDFSFIKHRKIYYIVTVSILIIGIGVGLLRGFNYGIDFTGGTMLQIDLGQKTTVSQVDKVLNSNDIKGADIVHYGEGNKGVIIKTTKALDKDARSDLLKDFYKEFDITEDNVESFEQFGPSIGDLLKQNAIKSVLIAAAGMLIYIIIRFEWKFGIASLVGVLHDVLIMIAFYGLFHVSINNPFIAAVLTVVGYSINDTIVVFDRVRENLNVMKKSQLDILIDKSINQTLVRSLTTSITTVLVLVPLFILGGETIKTFTLPLIVGIVEGAASSIFICSPLYYDLSMLGNKPKYNAKSGGKKNKKSKKNSNKIKSDGAVV